MSETLIGYTNSNTTCTSVPLTDLALAKKDLENHFSITKGEKWQLPDFGTNIPYYLFEPLTDTVVELIKEDVISVVSYDPRLEIINNNIQVNEDAHTVIVDVELLYIPLATVFYLELKFDKEAAQLEEF